MTKKQREVSPFVRALCVYLKLISWKKIDLLIKRVIRFTKGGRYPLRSNRHVETPIVETSRQLFIVLQKCDESDDDDNKENNSSVICLESDSSDGESSVEFVSETKTPQKESQLLRLNNKIADLEHQLRKEKAKRIECTSTIDHQKVQTNVLPTDNAIAIAFSSTGAAAATSSTALPSITVNATEPIVDPNNQLVSSFSDSFIERTAAEIAGNPDEFAAFMKIIEES